MSETAFVSAGRTSARARHGAYWPADLLAALLFLALGIGLVLHPYTVGRALPGDLGDSRFNLSLLEFFYRTLISALHGRPFSFVDAPFFYPWPRVTNFSDTFWGVAEIYALFRALGMDPIASFQGWFLAGFALTYIAAFVSFRKLGLRSWGAAAGAFLFAFPLPMAAQFDHVQLVYRLWIPLALLALDRFLTRRNLRAGAACLLFVSLELAASIYLGLFLCLFLASYAVSLCLIGRNRLDPPGWAALRSAGVAGFAAAFIMLAAGLVIIALVGVPYLDVQSMYGFARSWHDVAQGLPRPASYLLAGASTQWPNLSNVFPVPSLVEQQIFPGLAAIIPFACFLLSKRARAHRPLAAPMLASVAILFVLTLDFDGHTLYRLIYLFPGFSAVRSVARIIFVMMLPLAVLLGMLIDDLTAVGPWRTPRGLAALALSALLVAECSLVGHDGSPPAAWRARLAAFEARLPGKLPPRAILAVATPSLGPGTDWSWILPMVDADLAAATLGVHTMNGYSGNYPPTWKTMTSCGDIADNIRAGRHFLAEHGLPPPRITPDRLVLIGFGPCDPIPLARDPPLDLGRTYHFAQGAAGNGFVADGFSYAESWGRWTDGRNAFLFFTLARTPPRPISLAIEANPLSPRADRRQVATIFANGQLCGRLAVTRSHPRAAVTCPAGTLHAGDNALRLRIARPTRPIDLGLNADRRHLGLGLISLTLVPSG